MNELITALDQLAETPQAISRIRELILQLAVQGRLVEQDPNDEPASSLLKKTKQEQLRLLGDKLITKPRISKPIAESDYPFPIPNNWIWTRIAQVGHDCGQKVPDKRFSYIDVSTVNKEKGIISSTIKILNAADAPSRARKIVKRGSLIYSLVRPYLLNIAIIDQDFDPEPIVSTAFAVIHPYSLINIRFIHSYLRSVSFTNYVENAMQGVAYPAINDGSFFDGLIPLPPFAEQQRIVAKVEQLLALCDQLEQQQTSREALRQQVQQSAIKQLLSELAQPADAQQIGQPSRPNSQPSLFAAPSSAIEPLADEQLSISNELAAEQQLFFEQFDELHTTPKAIGQLRELILQLAVQGRLVAQDPSDGPASRLLERIQAEKQQMLGKLPIDPIEKIKGDYHIPHNWIWTNLSQLGVIGPRNQLEDDQLVSFIPMASIPAGYSMVLHTESRPWAEVKKGFTHFAEGDIALAKITPCFENRKSVIMTNLINRYGAGTTELHMFRPPTFGLDPKYVLFYLKSPKFITDGVLTMTGTAGHKRIPNQYFAYNPFPLPPFAEQQRIVAKVEQLMGLCDQLEQQLAQSQDLGSRSLAALIQYALV